MEDKSKVAEFYAGKSVLVTGATGFVGKVIVEKLLRSCPDISKVYVLMRKKRGLGPEERLKAYIMNPLFEPLRKINPTAMDKVRLIAGDVLEDDLGISNDDLIELQQNCEMVFHSAACVRFDQKLKDAVELNTRGTQRVLQLAKTMKNLLALVHLSTAYCRCELPSLEEKVYKAEQPPQKIIEMVQWMSDDLQEYIEPKLIGTEPNTYSYTKAMTESLVADFKGQFPIAIARPSIVTAVWKDPIPGWVDNLNGPTGLLIGAGKGVIRSMHCNPEYKADAVPVDLVANGCILIGYVTAMERSKEVSVYNITLSGAISLRWGEIIERGKKVVNEYPPLLGLWYPGGSPKAYKWVHQLCVIFTHYLPAYCVDLLLYLLGKKTFMVKLQHRISHGIGILQHYTVKEWHFLNENYKGLRNKVSKVDDEIFYTDVSTLNFDEYLKTYILGARFYCTKEDPSTLPRARQLHQIRFLADLILKLFFISIMLWFLFTYADFFISCIWSLDETLRSISPFKTRVVEEV